MSKFDPFGGLERDIAFLFKWGKFSINTGRNLKARAARQRVEELYGPEVADAVEAAVRSGRDPNAIIERARRDLAAREERDRQIADPPPLYGSARWPTSDELKPYLRDRQAFTDPRSLLLGTFTDEGATTPAGFVHWDGDGHLLTIAPTRSGKALTTIIPNMLRYQGSCVVIDPKGEIYDTTSKWRSTLGPVYRIAPFDQGTGKPIHRFDPLSRVKSEADARAIALQMFPHDGKSPEFFMDDAVGIMTGFIMYVKYKAPPHRQTMATVCQMAMLKGKDLLRLARELETFPPSKDAGTVILEKDAQRGLKTLESTLSSKMFAWKNPLIQRSMSGNDVSFEGLKDQTATIYIEVGFDFIDTVSAYLRVVLKAALDAMLTNPRIPEIPVLFLLDEFLSLGPFPAYRDAIRTHAGAGVRLWFFLQDIATIESHYPNNSWGPFLNCAVKQFFGINDDRTATMIGNYLGHKTHAIRTTSASANVSSHLGGWFGDASTNSGFSMTESVQFLGRPLLTSNEVRLLLGGWQGDGWRYGITDIAGVRSFKTQLVVHEKSENCRQRVGRVTQGELR